MEELPYPPVPRNIHTVLSGRQVMSDMHFMLLGAQLSIEIEDRFRKSAISDAWIMLMRTRIGPDVPPAKKNLAVFLKYS